MSYNVSVMHVGNHIHVSHDYNTVPGRGKIFTTNSNMAEVINPFPHNYM